MLMGRALRLFGITGLLGGLIAACPLPAASTDGYDPWPGLVQDIFSNRSMNDGSDVIADLRRQLVACHIDHTRALRISPEHHLGVRAVCHRALDMGVRITGTGPRAVDVIVGRRVVVRVDVHGLPGKLRGERVDESLTGPAGADGLASAASEHHLGVRTTISSGNTNPARSAEQGQDH